MTKPKRGRAMKLLTGVIAALVTAGGCSDQQASRIGDAAEQTARTTSKAMSEAARVLAQGAKRVRQNLGEAEQTGKVFARLHWDKLLHEAQITIDSEPGGVVRLGGTAPNETVHRRILDLVANTVGVTEVHDSIRVMAPGRTATATRPGERPPL